MKPLDFFERVKQECLKYDIIPYTLWYYEMDIEYYTNDKGNHITDIGIYPFNRKIEYDKLNQNTFTKKFNTYLSDKVLYKFFVFINNKDELDFRLIKNMIGYDIFDTKNASVGCNYNPYGYTITSIYNNDDDNSIYIRDIYGLIYNKDTIKMISDPDFKPYTEEYGFIHVYKENNI